MGEKIEPSDHGEQFAVKYILIRRDIDGHNEVNQAGPKAPSTVGIVDFHQFMSDHKIDPRELCQFLKISWKDIQRLVKHGGWIEPCAKENILNLLRACCPITRNNMWRFLAAQDGNAGGKNVQLK